MFFWIIIISVIVILIGTATTILLGKKQNTRQNDVYGKKSPKTLITILIIYIVSLIVGIIWAIQSFR